ncbi:hypothetical protein GP486_006983, partial [Trichoglossum hirsutum]
MDNQGDIRTLSSHCVSGFDELVKSLAICPEELHRHMSPRAVDNDFARFKIWCGNLGALQRGRSSLDVRLRDSTVMRETVLRFLSQLQDSLKQSIEITTGSRTPWEELKRSSEDTPTEEGRMHEYGDFNIEDVDEESDTGDENNGELVERQSEIQDTIAHLYRLSFKMRNASHRSLSIKALSIKVVDLETGEDLFSGYASFDYQYVLESLQQLRRVPQPLTPDLQPVRRVNDIPAFLLERLSTAITNRRRYFAYWQRHALKLSRIIDEPVAPQKNPITSREMKHEELLAGPMMQPRDQDRLNVFPNRASLMPISGPKTMISGTDISKYQGNLDNRIDTQTVLSYATTAKDIEGNPVNLPPPPADASSKPEFVCPYCWVACPSRQGKGKSWQSHILQDLQPYVCTFRDCSDGDRLYANREAWIEHERLCHRRKWRCFERLHRNLFYNSKEQLHLHFSESHTDLTELQIQNLLELVETTVADDREVCPFCSSAGPFDKGLYSHMAFHQERLATFAAPRTTDENKGDEIHSGKAQGIRSAGSLRSISLHFSNASDADTSAQSEDCGGELWTASAEGREEAVKLLLDKGTEVNAQGGEFGNTLQAASAGGHEQIVKLLLDKGAEVNAQGGVYGSALQAASVGGHEQIVKLLLDKGAEVNAQGGVYGNALQAASAGGHEQIVKLLLDGGAEVNAQGGEYGNAFWGAMANGHKQVVKLLLDKGANINAQVGGHDNALREAARGGHLEA